MSETVRNIHAALQVECLSEGGYVVKGCGAYRLDRDNFTGTEPIAAFTSLEEAIKWMASRMLNREPAV